MLILIINLSEAHCHNPAYKQSTGALAVYHKAGQNAPYNKPLVTVTSISRAGLPKPYRIIKNKYHTSDIYVYYRLTMPYEVRVITQNQSAALCAIYSHYRLTTPEIAKDSIPNL